MIVRLALLILFVLGGGSAASGRSPAGEYRLVGEQDVASAIRLRPDGRFQYFLAAGALDEQAEGRWTAAGGLVTLVTEPKPVPPRFDRAASRRTGSAPLTVKVESSDGRGIAGVDVRVGFDEGEPVEGYTQEDGWSLPIGERRLPRWIELAVPMHGLASPRFPIDLAAGNALDFTLVRNDLGIVDFEGVTIRVAKAALIVERGRGRLRYERVRRR
ncbi:MAG TPA: hypothetical protein VF759_11830 [Allosphingosinicella sp.]|jgi:hypothetical protein